ncbi:hypothetical protein TSOC_001050 [Tetrabaena socialis]|uniref:Uncharacterized protein n=1 Tax=Tetrabaena socialis TaxID=47790 RepID=A0A2J8AHR0_9CHLO|nr:hypothetical protein TSOC_001050 [Tetrabaena socialis]|eukprot:PNH12041.1 hypothetical protein TSOC_001050 [Tetrabaena socialis]
MDCKGEPAAGGGGGAAEETQDAGPGASLLSPAC